MIPTDMQLSATGPTWQVLTIGLVGLMVLIATAYIKSLERRIIKTESDLENLNKLVLRDYHNKEEMNRILQRIENGVTAVHRRLDQEFAKSGFHSTHGDG